MTPGDVDTILWRLDQQDRKLDRIEQHAQTTNGRVGKLELWQARIEGAKWAVSWAPPVVTAAGAAVLGAVVGKLLGL